MTLEFLKSITFGADHIEETAEGFTFHRFSKEQEALYHERDLDFYKKARSTAGVFMEFHTDSPTLTLSFEAGAGSSRDYFAFSLFVNGEKTDELAGNVCPTPGTWYPYNKTFNLGEGMKRVKLYFPWSASIRLTELALKKDSQILTVSKSKQMLIYGDSITQGYDAAHPEKAYAVQLTDHLDANAINKAVGGEIFWPGLASTVESISPDLITVAYGTNDWSKCTFEELKENCHAFYTVLCKKYPGTPIYALAPIWRADHVREEKVDFTEVCKYFREIEAEFEQVTLFDAYDYVPHDPQYFWDSYLHPNDAGFQHYIDGFWAELKQIL